MAGDGAYVGRDVAVEYSLDQSTTVIPTDFVRLGAMRAKSFGNEWDTVDVTADTSPGNTRQNLVTYKSFNPSGSGISSGDDTTNQDALELYVNNPTNGQPCGWIRITRPTGPSTTRSYTLPVIFSTYTVEAPYDDVVTWTLDTISNGSVTIIDA